MRLDTVAQVGPSLGIEHEHGCVAEARIAGCAARDGSFDEEPMVSATGKAAGPVTAGPAARSGAMLAVQSQSGRAARQRPRPGTGGMSSHAPSPYPAPEHVAFARWFADWWLRRGRDLNQQA